MLPWVAVQVLPVRAVVHPVVRRGVDHRLGRAQAADGLGVDPELVQQVHPPCRENEPRRDAEQAQDPVGGQDAEHVGHRLAQGGGQVVVLARVVDHVVGPHVPALVHEPVVPVVDEVPPEHRQDQGQRAAPRSPTRRRRQKRSGVVRQAQVVVTASRPGPPPPPHPPTPPGAPGGRPGPGCGGSGDGPCDPVAGHRPGASGGRRRGHQAPAGGGTGTVVAARRTTASAAVVTATAAAAAATSTLP